MAESTMHVNCNACDDDVRKDTYIVHIIKNHPEFFWRDVFTLFKDEHDTLQNRRITQMKDAISVLDTGCSYELDDELYVDFGDKRTYKKPETATGHALKHTEKHINNFVDLLKMGLTRQTLRELFAFIVSKPTKVINDEQAVKDRTAKGIAEEMKKYDIAELQRINTLYEYYMASEEKCDKEQLQKTVYDLTNQNTELTAKLNTVIRELNCYRQAENDRESSSYGKLQEEVEAFSSYEKAKKNCEDRVKKIEAECEKKLKKAKQDTEATLEKAEAECDKKMKKVREEHNAIVEKLEKKIKKQDTVIKVLKFEKEMADRKVDADSDSD
jgi:hypothetical protein